MDQYWKHKRVVFITTKNLDYIRNQQEINMLKAEANELTIIGSEDKGYFSRLVKIFIRLLFGRFQDYDTIFIGFAPQLILPFFHFKFRQNVIVEDFFISFFDTLCCDRKKFRENSLAGSLLKHLDERTLRLADAVICDTRAHGQFFCDDLGCDPSKIHVLYLEADRSIYYPREKKIQNNSITHVLYFGSVLPLQGVDVIMRAVELLKARQDISFEIIGPLPGSLQVNADNVTYHKWLTQQDLAEHIADSDLCLAGHFAADIEKAKRTIPGKAYIYESMQKPMILGENPANRERYQEGKGIWFVQMGDPEALAEMITRACVEIKAADRAKHNSENSFN